MHSSIRRAPAHHILTIPSLTWRALGTLLVTIAVLLTGTTAYAHDTLTDSSPAEGETLDEAPSELRLTYSANVLELGAEVVVTDSDGATVATGEPSVDGADVTVALEDALPNGSYEITWRVTSSDGHPISGVIPFSVEAAEATTEESTEESTEEPTEDAAPATGAPAQDDAATSSEAEAPSSPSADDSATADDTTAEAADETADDAAAADTASESDDSSGFPWLPVGIGIVVALIAFTVVRTVRRNDGA